MAALTRFVKTDNTLRTTGTVTPVELTDYTIAWSDLTGAGFVAGDDVVILVGIKTWSSSANANTYFAVGFGTTFAGRSEEADSVQRAEPTGTDAGDQYLWVDRRTLVTNENIYFRGMAFGGTSRYQEFTCFIGKLDDLTANDFVYDEETHSGGTSDAYNTSGASITTPAAGDWFFAASSRWNVNNTASDMLLAIHDGTSDVSEVKTEGEDTGDERVFGTFAYRAGLGSGVTVRARYRVDANGTQEAVATKIFGLRLDAFEDHAGAHTTNTVTHSVLDTHQEFAGFGSYGLTTTGPFVVIGWPIHTIENANKRPYGRIQIGGSDWPAANSNRIAVGDNGDTACRLAPFLFGYNASQSSGTLDIDLDCAEDADVTPTYDSVEQVAVAFSLTLDAGGADVTATPGAGDIDLAGLAPTLAASSTAASATGSLRVTGFAPTFAAHVAATPATGIVQLAGAAPTIAASSSISLAAGTVAITGFAPIVAAEALVQPGAGAVAVTGHSPTVSAGVESQPDAGTLAVTGFAPTADVASNVTAETQTGTVEIDGQAPTVAASVSVTPSTGTIEIAGSEPTVTASSSVTPDTGIIDATGFAPTVEAAGNVSGSPQAGALAITGHAPTVAANAAVIPAAGALDATGYAPTFAADHTAAPAQGSLAVTGAVPAVSAAATVNQQVGALAVTGHEPDVSVTAAGEAQPGVGILRIVGFEPTVSVSVAVTADAGQIAVAGYVPTVTATTETESLPQTGSIEIVGHAPTVAASSSAAPGVGTVAITGYAPSAGAGADVSLTLGTGTLVVVGHAPEFAAHFTAAANDGGLVLAGFAPALTTEHFIEVPAANIAVIGYPPVLIEPQAWRVIPVEGRGARIEVIGRGVMPVGSKDRQYAVSGRRRVIRVGPRGGSSAA